MDRLKRKRSRSGFLAALFASFVVASAQAQIATDATISVDSSYSGYDSSVVDDGVIEASGGTSTTWASVESTTEPHWVEFEFDEPITLDSATMHWAYNNNQAQHMASQQVDVQVWNGSSYQTVATITPSGIERYDSVDFEPTATTKLRFYQPAGMGPSSYPAVMWLTEIDLNIISQVKVDSSYSGYDTVAIDDGEIDATGGTSTTWASAESTTEPHWVEIEFDEPTSMDSATIHWAYNNNQDQYMASQQVEVQVWDGSGYRTAATMNPADSEESTTASFPPLSTTKLRFYQPAGMGPSSYPAVMWLTEVEYGTESQITVDSTYPGYDIAAINDGVIDATGGTNTTWASRESETEPHWVEIELDDPMVESVTIHWAYNEKQDEYMTSQHVEVQVGSTVLDVATPTEPEASTTLTFHPRSLRSIRIYQPAGQGPSSYNTVMWVTEIEVGLRQHPLARFTTEPSRGFEAGVAIGFTDTSIDEDGTITEWRWDFGDGNVSTDQNPIHTYEQGGKYIAELEVVDDDGRTGMMSRQIHVAGTVADSTYSGYSESAIDDGVIDADGGTSTTWASSESDNESHWVALYFAEREEVDFATIYWAYNDYQGQYMASQEVQVQAWDGWSYRTIATIYPTPGETETTVTFDPVTTRGLRFYQPPGQGPATYDKVMWLTEIDYGLSD